jgi:hypothetical protein
MVAGIVLILEKSQILLPLATPLFLLEKHGHLGKLQTFLVRAERRFGWRMIRSKAFQASRARETIALQPLRNEFHDGKGHPMSIERRVFSAAALASSVLCASMLAQAPVRHPVQNPNLNPNTLVYITPSNLHWTTKSDGLEVAVVMGDPGKAGPYILFAKWLPHHMSHPHFHPNDRYITVISGSWWVGTGTVFQPDKTVPMHAGTFVTHFAKQIHYDGAKDEECVIEIVGEGPAPTIPAEKK